MDFEIDWSCAGMALGFWAVALIPIWGNVPMFSFSNDYMRIHVKIILTIILLPICYLLIYKILGGD